MFTDFENKLGRKNAMVADIVPFVTETLAVPGVVGGLYKAGEGIVNAVTPNAPAPITSSIIDPSQVNAEAAAQAEARYNNELERLKRVARGAPTPQNLQALKDFMDGKDRIIGETQAGLQQELGARAAETAFDPEGALEAERQALRDSQAVAQQQTLAQQLMAAGQNMPGTQIGMRMMDQAAAMQEGPSAAQAMLQQRSDDAMRQAFALSRSQPGMAAGLAARQAQQAGQRAQLGLSQQASQMRAQEQADFRNRQLAAQQFGAQLAAKEQQDINQQRLQAQQLAGGVLSQIRGQDLGVLGAGTQIEQQRVGTGLTRAQMEQDRKIADARIAAGLEEAGTKAKTQLIGTGLKAVGAGTSMALKGS